MYPIPTNTAATSASGADGTPCKLDAAVLMTEKKAKNPRKPRATSIFWSRAAGSSELMVLTMAANNDPWFGGG